MESISFFIRITFLFTEIRGYLRSVKVLLFEYKEDVKSGLTPPKTCRNDWYLLSERNHLCKVMSY